MAKIVKTKSGKYHTKVFCGFDARGKKIEKSITAPTIKEVKRLVALATIEDPQTYENLTVREAYERYIDSKANTLSPKTLKEYRAAVERDFPLLLNLRLSQLRNEMIQTAVNEITATCSPKTVRNKYYLLESVLKAYAPDLTLSVRLPQKIKPEEYVPTYSDVRRLLDAANEKTRVPILLAAFAGLRLSEICALTPNDITDVCVIVNKAKVDGEYGFAIKQPKTNKGYRNPPLSPDIVKECRAWRYFGISPNTLSNNFRRLRDQVGVPIHFHLLRHFYAASLIDKGLDMMTIMTYGGWESIEMVTKIYGYVMRDRQKDNRVVSIYSDFKQNQKQKKKTSVVS